MRPKLRLCPTACPTPRFPIVKRNRAGIIIRVSGVRVPPPASPKALQMRGFPRLWGAADPPRGETGETARRRRAARARGKAPGARARSGPHGERLAACERCGRAVHRLRAPGPQTAPEGASAIAGRRSGDAPTPLTPARIRAGRISAPSTPTSGRRGCARRCAFSRLPAGDGGRQRPAAWRSWDPQPG